MGVPLGTVIADHWRWQDAFTMCVVITAVATIIALLVLPKNLNAGEGNYSDRFRFSRIKQSGMGSASLSVRQLPCMAITRILDRWFMCNLSSI